MCGVITLFKIITSRNERILKVCWAGPPSTFETDHGKIGHASDDNFGKTATETVFENSWNRYLFSKVYLSVEWFSRKIYMLSSNKSKFSRNVHLFVEEPIFKFFFNIISYGLNSRRYPSPPSKNIFRLWVSVAAFDTVLWFKSTMRLIGSVSYRVRERISFISNINNEKSRIHIWYIILLTPCHEKSPTRLYNVYACFVC